MTLNGNNLRSGLMAVSATLAACCLTTAAAEPRPLAKLPDVSRIWMGMEEGSVRPAFYQQVRSELEGPFELFCKDGEMLERAKHWATLDAEQLEIEKQTMEVEEVKMKRLIQKSEDDAEDARIRTLLEIHEAEVKHEELEATLASADFPNKMRQRAMAVKTDLKARIAKLRERTDPAVIAEQLQADRQEAELQMTRKRKQFEQLKRRSMLTAENTGVLRLSDSLREKLKHASADGGPVWVKPGDHLATIVDDRTLEIIVQAAGSTLAQIPIAELAVFLQDGKTGKLIPGTYSRTDEVDTGMEISRNYVFSIPPQAVEDARRAMGHRHLVHIYRMFSEKFKLVHKKDIAFLAPEVLEESGWNGLVRHLWPGCKIVQVGPQTIVMDAKNAN